MLLVTGGAGFIGANFVHEWFKNSDEHLLVLDKLTYAGKLSTIKDFCNKGLIKFIHGDIGDEKLLLEIFKEYEIKGVINFAAETHVDRSIINPNLFVQTNIVGTATLLKESYQYWLRLSKFSKEEFRFLHVSTDEVFGSLYLNDKPVDESARYLPNNPYSASKASSDHLVRAYNKTYGFPTLTTNCSNNYGPYQDPEKFIPMLISNALDDKKLPIYGAGINIRDWLYVVDHCAALRMILQNGTPGETYNIGGNNQYNNLEVVTFVCDALDICTPKSLGRYHDQIQFVPDRLGHDLRYHIDCNKLFTTLGWSPSYTFKDGIKKTVSWYVNNKDWLEIPKNRMEYI